MKKIVSLIAIIAILSLVLAACSQSTPAPASPAAKPPPGTAPSATQAGAGHPIVELELISHVSGTSGYQLCYGLAQIVSKNHPWLRVTGVEGRGSTPNLQILASKPEKWKNTLIFSNEFADYTARLGKQPFTKAYTGERAIMALTSTISPMWTRDKSVKSPADLAGKRIMLDVQGNENTVMWEYFLKRWGVWDKVKVSYGDPKASTDAFKDGLVDVIGPATGFGCTPGGLPPISAAGAMVELFNTRKDMGWVNLTSEDIKAYTKDTGYPTTLIALPPGTMDKYGNKQPEPITTFSLVNGLYCDNSIETETIYELVKAVYDSTDEFPKVVGPQGERVQKKTLGYIPLSQDIFHPGALRFYKEKGVKIGIE